MSKLAVLATMTCLWIGGVAAGYVYLDRPTGAAQQLINRINDAAEAGDVRSASELLSALGKIDRNNSDILAYKLSGVGLLGRAASTRHVTKKDLIRIAAEDPSLRRLAYRAIASNELSHVATRGAGVRAFWLLAQAGDGDAALDLVNSIGGRLSPSTQIYLLRKAASRRSAAALRVSQLLAINSKLAIDPFESADYLRSAERLMREEAAQGSAKSMVTLADLIVKEGSSAGAVRDAASLYSEADKAGSLDGAVKLAILLRNRRLPVFDPERSVALLKRAANAGSHTAIYELGETYRLGLGFAPNTQLALRYYRRAASEGSPGAAFRLGEMYATGIGVVVQPKVAYEWYVVAAAAGSAAANLRIAQCYVSGTVVGRDYRKALYFATKAAHAGSSSAMAFLSRAYGAGTIVDRDIPASEAWALRALAAGSTSESVVVTAAQSYLEGHSSPLDIDRSVALLSGAVARGSVDAKLKLGGLLLSIGGADNERKGLHMFQRAASTGDGGALAALGSIYASGNGVPVNAGTSFRYYSLAASREEASGYRGLGIAYASGFGVRQDINRALSLYAVGAKLGDLRSIMLLAACYTDGCGHAPQPKRANALIEQAATMGDNDATYQYSMLILRGEVAGSKDRAMAMLNEVAQEGYAPASAELKRLGASDPREEQRLNEQRRVAEAGADK